MRSIKTFFVLYSRCLAHRIQQEEGQELDVEVSASVADPPQTMDTLPSGAGDAVDWHFMTKTFSWEGRTQNDYDTVQGHTCQGSYYDISYSASSLCYWHPEKAHADPQSWGVKWSGGYGPQEFSCGGEILRGVCARCQVCHDNSRDRDAEVDSENEHVVPIPLPSGCMKEEAIEAACTAEFDSNNRAQVDEADQCTQVSGQYDEAVVNHDTLNANIHTSESAMTQLTTDMGNAYLELARHQADFHAAREQIRAAKRLVARHCHRFGVRDNQGARKMLELKPTCTAPTPSLMEGAKDARLIDESEDDEYILEESEYDEESSLMEESEFDFEQAARRRRRGCRIELVAQGNEYEQCQQCTCSMDNLESAIPERDSSRSEVESLEGRIQQHTQDMTSHRQTLERSYQNLPQVRESLGATEAEWLPQQAHCQVVHTSLADARNAHAMVCPRGFYDQSCEKACIEIQRTGEHGCGVVEGSQNGDALGRGGINVTCSPPATSWIMDPSGGAHSDEQCERINAEQSARMTTPIMMSGWLRRDDRRRFFVLESGNGVRSAALRSFRGALPGGTEETNKGIVLWDAESVSAGETDDSQACFDVKHRYRGRDTSYHRRGTTITICLKIDDYPQGNIAELRDQWVSALQPLLIWRARGLD